MEDKKIKVIITGSSGMVGEGVLYECLSDPRVRSILVLNRKPSHLIHPKLTEIVLSDLSALSPFEQRFTGYTTCFYCVGTTSVGKTEPEYFETTYSLTMSIASKITSLNPGIVFCYLSAAGADTTEKGKSMWARVKGKTENDLKKISLGNFFVFRPFLLTPTKGLKKTHPFYRYISWLFPLSRLLYPKGFCTLRELALAMITVGVRGFPRTVITPPDMVKLVKSA